MNKKTTTAGALSAVLLAPAAALALSVSPAGAVEPGTQVQLLGINDFHGRVAEAGVDLAATVERLRAESEAATVFLSAGDDIGASTYVSSSQQDKPVLDIHNALGMDVAALGNHEFDQGWSDIADRVNPETDFPWLGANVYERGTQNVPEAIDSYAIIEAGEVRVAVIGVVTEETASLVDPSGIEAIEFGDPTDAVNRTVAEIESLPEAEQPDLTVVSAHLGSNVTSDVDAGIASNPEFGKLITESDASVDAFYTGHTHVEYTWEAPVPGEPERTRPVIQTGSYGENVGRIVLSADESGNWTTEVLENVPTADESFSNAVVEQVQAIVDEAVATAEELGSRVVGEITDDITRARTADGAEDRGAESTLGNLVADALQAGTGYSQLEGSDFALTNPGGLRTDLLVDDQYADEAPGEVTVAELNAVLPFANDHGVVTLTGADVLGVLEEQWQPAGSARPFLHLGISEELEVVYDSSDDAEQRIVYAAVNGEEIDPEATYRVATLSFLAAGGDNFTSFANGEWEQSGLTDFEVWERYFTENTPVSPDYDERQADLALDIIANGTAEVRFGADEDPLRIPAGGTAEAYIVADSAEPVTGPFRVTVDLPEGVTVQGAEANAAFLGALRGGLDDEDLVEAFNAQEEIVIDELPAGESTLTLTFSAAEDAAAGAATIGVQLQADPQATWWDDNPLPLPYSAELNVEVTADEPAPTEPTPTEPGQPTPTDPGQPGGEPTPTQPGSDPGAGPGPGDGKPLPRTGSDVAGLLGLALALLAAGGVAVAAGMRRRGAGSQL